MRKLAIYFNRLGPALMVFALEGKPCSFEDGHQRFRAAFGEELEEDGKLSPTPEE